MALTGYVGISLALLGWVVLILYRQTRQDKCNIPGPKGVPIFGNLLQFANKPHRQLQRWAKEYGDIFRLKLGWETWVFINSPEDVREIFDKRSAVTSSRMPMPVLCGVFSGDHRILFLPYGERWRKLRTILHKSLTPKASDTYKPSQEFESKQLIYDFATDNEDQKSFYMHVRRYTTSVVMLSTYGIRVPTWDCDDIKEIYRVLLDFTTNGEPGAYLADTIPPLAKLPKSLQWWRPSAEAGFERQKKTWMRYWNRLQASLKEGKAPECLVKQLAETDLKEQDISDVQAGFLAGSMIEAGSETTSAAINIAILYLAANPDVQERANEEITRVVGDHRSPTYDDEDNLPYIRAMGKETLRIRPITTMGTPHYTSADIEYKGYFIPKNSVVCFSQYVLHYDERRWKDGGTAFDPSRYLDYPHKAGVYAASADANKRDHFDFGAGRRICPGMHLAENSIFITLARILWAFRIEPGLGPDGQPLPVDVSDEAFEPGVNTIAKPFKVRFVPRNETRARVLREEWKEAEKNGFTLGNAKVDSKGVVVV